VAAKSADVQILLHERKLSLLEALLSIELVDFGLETPFVLSESFIIHFLLL